MPNTKLFKQSFATTIIFLLIITWSNSLVAHDGAKIAVVNLEYVVAKSPEGKKMQTKLQNFQNEMQAKLSEIKTKLADKKNEMNQISKKIAEGSNSLSQENLTELEKQYEDLKISLRRFLDDKQRQTQKLQTESLRQVELSLVPVFNKIKE